MMAHVTRKRILPKSARESNEWSEKTHKKGRIAQWQGAALKGAFRTIELGSAGLAHRVQQLIMDKRGMGLTSTTNSSHSNSR